MNANFAGVGAGWSYDPFGNRQSESWTGNNDTAVPGSTSATYYGNNQLSWTNVNAAGSNVTYDQAGNMTYDGKNSYLYDAEGRICALGETVNGTTILTGYIYDAGGTRVAKGSLASFSCNFAPSKLHNQHKLGTWSGRRAGHRVCGQRRHQHLAAYQRICRGQAAGHLQRHRTPTST